jgi:hypothetical protein
VTAEVTTVARKKIPMIIFMGAQFALLGKMLAIGNDQEVAAIEVSAEITRRHK